jgi:hypothetical protein
MDRAAAALSGVTGVVGGDLSQQRAQTQQAHTNLGPADLAAFSTGFGRLGPTYGYGAYRGVESAQQGTDPYSASILTNPLGVVGNRALGLAEGKAADIVAKAVDPALRYAFNPSPADVPFPRGNYTERKPGLGLSVGVPYPQNMSAEDVAKFARELTGVAKDDPQSFAPIAQQRINDALGGIPATPKNPAMPGATPDQLNAVRQAYGGDIPSGDTPPPSLLRRAMNWGATGLRGLAGGTVGHALGFGTPDGHAAGALAGGWWAIKWRTRCRADFLPASIRCCAKAPRRASAT